jgi:Fic family protein
MRARLLERTNLNSLPDSIANSAASLNTWGTNAIEGSTISKKEAERILLDGESPGGKPVRDILVTIQHERTFKKLLKTEKKVITLEMVLDLHEDVFIHILPDAGTWRRINVRIRGVRVSPPRMEKVITEMQEWTENYHRMDLEGENVFSLGTWMHYEFERIHPFADGNGRIGRLLLNFHFLKRNWPPVHVLPVHRNDYLNCLNEAAGGDLSHLEEFLKVLSASSLLDLLDQLGTKKDRLISLKEASKITGYSEKYIALRCKQGKIPSLRDGREWRTSQWAMELYADYIGRDKGH